MEEERVLVSTSWQQRLGNENYKNWLKVGYALSIACDGTRPYIERETKAFHASLTAKLHGIPSCTCTHTPRRRPNPYHDMIMCDWAKELKNHHNGKPTWNQSDGSLWNDPNVGYWEIAKLYMPFGCATGKVCAAETDATGLLNLLCWCDYFKTDRTLVERLKDTRNIWAHAATQELDTTATTEAFLAMKDVLQDPELTTDGDAIDALNEITALENDALIDFEDLETKVVYQLKKSMTSMKDELAAKIDSMKDQEDVNASEIKNEICQVNEILIYCMKVGKERDSLLCNMESVLCNMQRQMDILIQSKAQEITRRRGMIHVINHFCKIVVLLAVLLYLRLPRVVPRRCITMAILLTRLTILDESHEEYGCGTRDKFDDPLELKEIDFNEYLNRAREGFVGRQWLFKNITDSLEKNQEKSKGVMIIGAPGFGKSALVSNLICSKLSSFSIHSQILGYHLCVHSHKNTKDGAKFVRNLAKMIMWRLQEYRYSVMKDKFIQKTLKDGCLSDPVGSFDQGILVPLSKLQLRFLKPMYIVVDALDECFNEKEFDKETSIVNILSHNIRRFPNWLKVIVTSRNVTMIRRKFSSLGIIELHPEDPRNMRDIERFITSKLHNSYISRFKSYFIQDFSIQALVDRSQGNFLYIKLVLEYLQTEGISSAAWTSLPSSINSVYQEFFERKFNTVEKFRGPRKIFEILVATLSPLTAEELYGVLLTENEDFDFEYDFLPILEELSVYLRNTQENQTVTVFHNSLTEWLTSNSNKGSMYYVDEKKGNRLLGDYFLNRTHDKSINVSPEFVFNLATYIVRGGNLKKHTERFFRLDSSLIETTDIRTKFNALHLAATTDNKNILDILINCFDDLDVKDRNGRTPAFVAAMTGRLDNLRLLHDEGASLSFVTKLSQSPVVQKDFFDEMNNCKNQLCEYTLLHVAAQQGHEHILEYLLNNNVDVSPLSGTGSSAMHLAAEYGHVEAMKTLMEHGANADDMCLYYAALRGQVDAVRFLLENGVKDNCIYCINIQNEHLRTSYNLILFGNYTRQCNTALHAAAIGDFPEVIEALLTSKHNAIKCVNYFGKEPLHEAVHHNNYDATNILLKFGVKTSGICKLTSTNFSYHCQDSCPCGYTPLHIAAHYGFAAITDLLLKYKADYNATDCEGLQPIHVASCRGHADILPILIKNGADVNSRGPNEMTPIHYACKCRADQVFYILFNLGADGRALSGENKPPVYYIFQDTLNDDFFLRDPYVDSPIDPISFNPQGRAQALHKMKGGNWFKSFTTFLESSVRVDSTLKLSEKHFFRSLVSMTKNESAKVDAYFTKIFGDFFGSTWSGIRGFFVYATPAFPFFLDMVVMEPILQKYYLNELQSRKENMLPQLLKTILIKTLLNITCSTVIGLTEKNVVFTVDTILDLGIDVNCEESGLSPLLVYLRQGGSNTAKVLVKHNVAIDIKCGEYFEDSVFHLAAYHKLHYLQYISAFHRANKWEEYLKGKYALFDYLFDEYDKITVEGQVKVTRVRDGPVTKAIKSHLRGFKIIDECLDNEGYTALHRAAQGGNVVAVKHFLKWEANVTKESPEGFDILTLTIWYAVKYRPYLNLHKHGLVTSLEIEFASLTAGVILKHLTKSKPFDIGCDHNKKTPTLLHLAATRGMWRFIDDLFTAKDHWNVVGLTANCPTKDNITPMYLAKLYGGDECDWDNPWCKVVQILSRYSDYAGKPEVRPNPHIEYFLIFNFLFHELPGKFDLELDKKELMILQEYTYKDDEECKEVHCLLIRADQKYHDIMRPLDTARKKFQTANDEFDTFLTIEISKIKATFFYLKNIEVVSLRCVKTKRTAGQSAKQLPDTSEKQCFHNVENEARSMKCSCENLFKDRSNRDRRIKFLNYPSEDACILNVCAPYATIGFESLNQILQENHQVYRSYYRSLKLETKKARRAVRKYALSLRLEKPSHLVQKFFDGYKERRDCELKEITYKYARFKFLLHTFEFWSAQVNKITMLPSISKYLSERIEEVFLNENKHEMIRLIIKLAKNHPMKYEYMKMLRFRKPPLFSRTIK